MSKKGYKQSFEHIQKRVKATAKAREEWSREKYNQWTSNISKNNRAGTLEVRTKNSIAHKGNIPWNKGNNWRDKFTIEELKTINAKRARKRRRQNIRVRIGDNMSSMIYLALKAKKNGRHWEDFVDYTLDELIVHLENQFQLNMSWDNYGEWHIDHKKPRSAFHFKNPNDIEFRKCWSLNNLQPLWAIDNLKKNATFKELVLE